MKQKLKNPKHPFVYPGFFFMFQKEKLIHDVLWLRSIHRLTLYLKHSFGFFQNFSQRYMSRRDEKRTIRYFLSKLIFLHPSRKDFILNIMHGQQSATSGWVRVQYRYLLLLRKSQRYSASRDRDQGCSWGPIDAELRRNFLSGHLSVVCLDVFLPFSK